MLVEWMKQEGLTAIHRSFSSSPQLFSIIFSVDTVTIAVRSCLARGRHSASGGPSSRELADAYSRCTQAFVFSVAN